MTDKMDFMQLCRLCLVKEQVNVEIFGNEGDIQDILLKINACLPVKIGKEDKLPKKICDGCVYKLDLLYQFWNTTTNAEKQLLAWLSASDDTKVDTDFIATPTEVILKEEPNTDVPEEVEDSESYVLQQQQIPYNHETPFEPEEAPEEMAKDDAEPPAKRPRRSAAVKAAPIIESDDEIDDPDDPDDPTVTKTEDSEFDDDDEDVDESEDMNNSEPTFVNVSEQDADKPGPSGLATTTDFPCILGDVEEVEIFQEEEQEHETNFQCEVCAQLFPTKRQFLEHHMSQFGSTFNCCRCDEAFTNTTELYHHYESHKNDLILMEPELTEEVVEEEQVQMDFIADENVETVIEADDSTNELLYILEDDTQAVNEVVIEHDGQKKLLTQDGENFTIVQVDHGYIIPSIFQGKLGVKRRYMKKEVKLEVDEDTQATDVLIQMQPSTSRMSTLNSSTPKPRAQPPKRRHELPDFSATNFEILNPTEDVDMQHYKCMRCEQLFINKFVFFRHIEKGKCYINSCDVCTATFNKNSDFFEHYNAAHTERAICNFCFRTFMYEKNVKEHMLRHLDQFRHRCEECNKGFYTVREYRNHYKNRHMGIRHKCDDCGRSFADEYYFKRHILTHSDRVQFMGN